MNACKVFALPYAVGSANIYTEMKKRLRREVEVVPIELSGHGSRLEEELNYNIHHMAQDVYNIIKDDLESPYCLFGYSMGSLICYELYYLILKSKKRLPEHMFLFASDTPHANRKKNYIQMCDEEIKEELGKLNGTSEEVLENNAIMELVLPIARADLVAVDEYCPTEPERKITCSASIVRGAKEMLIDNSIEDWGKYFTDKVQCKFSEGGHFFFFENLKNEIGNLSRELRRFLL